MRNHIKSKHQTIFTDQSNKERQVSITAFTTGEHYCTHERAEKITYLIEK